MVQVEAEACTRSMGMGMAQDKLMGQPGQPRSDADRSAPSMSEMQMGVRHDIGGLRDPITPAPTIRQRPAGGQCADGLCKSRGMP